MNETVSTIVGTVSFVLTVSIMIIPRSLGVVHRIYALPTYFMGPGVFGILMAIMPQSIVISGEDPLLIRSAGLIFLAIWGVTARIAHIVVRRSTDEHVRRGFWRGLYARWITHDSVYQSYVARIAEQKNARRQVSEDRRIARRKQLHSQIADKAQAAEKARQCVAATGREAIEREALETYRQQVAKAKQEANRVRMLNQMEEEGRATQRRIDGTANAPSWANTDDRLNIAFENYRAGLATLEDYEAAITSEAESIKDRAAEIRENRKLYGEEYYESEKEQLDEDRDAVQWRKRWLSDERYRLKNSRPGFAPSGKWSRFEYVDADGVITKRHVVNWERRGAYIVGYDKDRREERTFRQDRISDWLAG